MAGKIYSRQCRITQCINKFIYGRKFIYILEKMPHPLPPLQKIGEKSPPLSPQKGGTGYKEEYLPRLSPPFVGIKRGLLGGEVKKEIYIKLI